MALLIYHRDITYTTLQGIYCHSLIPVDLPTCLLVMHEPRAVSFILFFSPFPAFAAVLINFRFVQVLLSLPPPAASVAVCVAATASCSCVWHAFNAGLRQATGCRPREIGMLQQHLCQCQHCQDVRVCHFARCVVSCLFCVFCNS